TGFSGNQILVRNIGVVDPANPPPTVTVSLPPPAPGTPAQATLVTVSNPQPGPANQSAASAVPANAAGNAIVTQSAASKEIVTQSAASAASGVEGQPPVAPPRAVFVAASVQPAAPTAEPLPPGVTALPEEIGIEARIVATRAAAIDLSELVAQPAQPAAKAPLPTAPVRATPVRAAQTPVIPPRITPAGTAPPTPVRAETIAPELALLARLRIPSLPFTLGAARIATNAASILPRALARLDAALAALAQGDARASTLRTIAGFITRIDPSNARALPEQLMAYIGNVVEGAESKLASMLRALTPEAEPPPVNVGTSAPASTTAPGNPVTNAASGDRVILSAATSLGINAAEGQLSAHAAERAVALQYDLKAAIVSLMETPPRGAPPELTAALGETLMAITGVQLNVLNAQNADPNTIVVPLPVFYHEGGRPAQLRISRDAPQGGKKLDADNFHIAFVLDTRTLGTVAVDLQTASRSVSVNVKTEAASAADRFKDSFADLRGRLEQLHYRVASVAASVAPHVRAPEPASPPTPPVILSAASLVEGQPKHHLDVQA
ncbi:MAG: flagellar hook-length control protein FliK, partial [Candidatus Eremiobacteraeota bacterium]|nr:flagellar hook-length control protein FliK [Candidatus Eremiobacteraeota bacterium]